MAFLTTEVVTLFDGPPGTSVHVNSLGTGQKVFKGSFPMIVNGTLYRGGPVPSAGLLAVAGADANGGLNLFSNQANVRYSQITGGANKTLGVSVTFGASVVDVIVQLATDGGGAATSTAQAVMNAVLGNALASKFLKINYTGTGAGVAAAFAASFVPVVTLCGTAMNTYDNAAGVAAISIPMVMQRGTIAVAPLATDPPTAAMIGSQVAFADDISVKATVGPLDLTVTLSDILPDGTVFVSTNL